MFDIRRLPLRFPRHLLRNRAGTSAVEFALLSPLFLMILLGMAAYGILIGATHSVQQIAADAARISIAGLGPDERQALATEFVMRNAGGYAFIEVSRIDVSARDNPDNPSQFTVTVEYDASELPIWNLFHGLPLPEMTIARRATIRNGGI